MVPVWASGMHRRRAVSAGVARAESCISGREGTFQRFCPDYPSGIFGINAFFDFSELPGLTDFTVTAKLTQTPPLPGLARRLPVDLRKFDMSRSYPSAVLLPAATIAFSIVVTIIQADTAPAQTAPPAAAGIPWQNNLRAAHSQAQSEGKLLLLHFYGDNCPWCDRLEAGAFRSPGVGQAIAEAYVPVKIHVGQNPSLAKMFKVQSLPTDVIVTTEGNALSHRVSPQKPNEYVAMLGTAAASARPAGTPPAQPTPTSGPMLAADPTTAGGQPPVDSTAAAPGPGAALKAPAGATVNEFVLPDDSVATGGTPGQTVGMRTDGMDLTMPAQVAAETNASPAKARTDATGDTPEKTAAGGREVPPLALEGYCAVTINEDYAWVEGKPQFGVVHLGRLYLFSSSENKEKFLADPMPYTPVMNELDVVRFFEERRIVQGKRDFGVKDPIHGRMFFFADQAARDHFENQFQRYSDAAVRVMGQAVQDANPL